MNFRIPRSFRLMRDAESFDVIQTNVNRDVRLYGTNLWILFFAILIASLGLNINSPAVVIGAMLISPLMGPIIGLGIGVAINSLAMIRVAAKNYALAALIGLVASTLYFLVTPLDEAHSEILARVSPNIYDVLIALFGGFAGSIAVSSKQKGNVIPGVAIATALMPPLCTAGYGLATWNLQFFFGAFYLYIINSVFIGVATLVTAYFLRFPSVIYKDPSLKRREAFIVWGVILLTLLPSIYFGYDMVKQHRFLEQAEAFVAAEAHFPNDYLLSKNIDPRKERISLTFGGEQIDDEQIHALRAKLADYELMSAKLEVRQGFSFINNSSDPKLGSVIPEQNAEWVMMQNQLDSIYKQRTLGKSVYRELKVMYPLLQEAIIAPALVYSDSIPERSSLLVWLKFDEGGRNDTTNLQEFLQVRLNRNDIRLLLE